MTEFYQHPSFTIADRIVDLIKQHDVMTAFWDELDTLDRCTFTADIAALVESYNPAITPLNVGESIIKILNRRGGFDHWWYSLHSENQAEILMALDRLVINNKVGADMNGYQERAHATSRNTRIGDDLVVYPVLGLCSEAGELAGKIKKIHRDNNGVITSEAREAIKLELGGVLWYLAETCTQLGLTLADVAEANVTQLADRAARGVIQGSGDNR